MRKHTTEAQKTGRKTELKRTRETEREKRRRGEKVPAAH